MKIFITTGIFPPDIGGPATQLDYFARSLMEKGLEVKVLTFGEKIAGENFSYTVKKVSRRLPEPIRTFVFFARTIIMAMGVDVIYTQDLYRAGFSSLVAKNILRKPLVTRLAGDSAWETAVNKGWTDDDIVIFQDKKYSFGIERKKWLRRKILTGSDAVIAVSSFMGRLAEKIGVDKEKIKIIYNSVDFFDPVIYHILKDDKCTEGDVILATAARLVPWKGIDTLIKIMPEVLVKHPAVKLLILGDGPQYNELVRLAEEKGVADSVIFKGRVSHNDLFRFLHCAKAFILNTNYEGLSHVLLEAMKIGVPIITTRVGGNPEVVEDGVNGMLVDYNSPGGIVRAIDRVLSDRALCEKFINNSREKLGQFNWQKLISQSIEVFAAVGAKK